jgi:5-enolpyruvylshikimate-3-phosphate synthase
MTPTQLKIVNTVAATAFSLTGVVCLVLAGFLAMTPAPVQHAQYVKRTPDVAHCIQALHELGISARKEGVLIDATVPQTDVDQNPKATIDAASVGIAACKLPLKAFCMGTACTQPGKSGNAQTPVGMVFSLGTVDPYAVPGE